MLRPIKVAAVLLITVGLAGWIHAILNVVLGDRLIALRYERPLTEPLGIAMDWEGRIYCGVPPYSRIQVYAADGKFIDSWYYRGTEEFRLRMNAQGLLEVADANRTRRGDLPDVVTTYDLSGRVLDRRELDGAWTRFGSGSERVLSQSSGDLLSIPDRHFFPRIEKRSASGDVAIIVRNSWLLWSVGAPLPTWFWMAIGAMLLRLRSHCR